MPGGKLNSVIILDALSGGDMQTARRLFDELRDISTYKATGLDVRYYKINNLSDLKTISSALASAAITHDLKPWIHLEAHGLSDESGFEFPDKSHCTWHQFKENITPINVNTDFNVMLILAACHGGSFAKAITTVDRAPVLGLIGPIKEILTGEVEVDFPEFYINFFNSGSLSSALKSLNISRPNLYYFTDAEKFFFDVWAGYKKDYCTEEKIEARARSIRKKIKVNESVPTPGLGQIKRRMRKEEPNAFNKYRDIYFMNDINPSNIKRFPVTYEKAEDYLAGKLKYK